MNRASRSRILVDTLMSIQSKSLIYQFFLATLLVLFPAIQEVHSRQYFEVQRTEQIYSGNQSEKVASLIDNQINGHDASIGCDVPGIKQWAKYHSEAFHIKLSILKASDQITSHCLHYDLLTKIFQQRDFDTRMTS